MAWSQEATLPPQQKARGQLPTDTSHDRPTPPAFAPFPVTCNGLLSVRGMICSFEHLKKYVGFLFLGLIQYSSEQPLSLSG